MKNVKDEVFAALQAVCDNVSDVYPTSWVDLPAIQYTEEENRVYERTANIKHLFVTGLISGIAGAHRGWRRL